MDFSFRRTRLGERTDHCQPAPTSASNPAWDCSYLYPSLARVTRTIDTEHYFLKLRLQLPGAWLSTIWYGALSKAGWRRMYGRAKDLRNERASSLLRSERNYSYVGTVVVPTTSCSNNLVYDEAGRDPGQIYRLHSGKSSVQ